MILGLGGRGGSRFFFRFLTISRLIVLVKIYGNLEGSVVEVFLSVSFFEDIGLVGLWGF